MKLLKLCVLSGLLAAALAPLKAESLSVNIPYSFVVGKVKMPAGAYIIQEEMLNGVITIRSADGKTVALLSSPGALTPDGAMPSLTFVNVGGEMVLTAIREASLPSRVLPRSPGQ